MKACFILPLALALGASARAQIIEEIPLQPPLPANAPQTIEEVVYRHGNYDDRGFNRAVQKVTVPTLTVYRPAKPAARGEALIVCPGGGYSYVAIDREGHALGRYFSARGITVAVLKYRLPDPSVTKDGLPLSQQDALAAVRYVRNRAQEWNLNPKRIGILGGSAGGHLAGSVGVLGQAADGTRPDFVTLLYPVICLEGPYAHQGSRTKLLGASPSPERIAEYSLERRARVDLPPYFFVHAKDDKGVPRQNSELFAAALKEKGVPAEVMIVETGGHGFGLGRDAESGRWKDAFLAWLGKLP
ncbi:alpha/beta hydrolase [Horticoccus sp. 23ND18S-11]|uniref:alpha/beta hydrolase n=1 Tax=Horticoccus sp. 23ND18S-11 TaxID=3391832 RepID=UPI0039C97E82